MTSQIEKNVTIQNYEYESFNNKNINMCRICLEEVDTITEYCKCKGNIGIVHHNCLLKWIKLNIIENKKDKLLCEICKSEFNLKIKKKNNYLGYLVLLLIIIFGVFIYFYYKFYLYIRKTISYDSKSSRATFIFFGLLFTIYYVKILYTIFSKNKIKIIKLLPRKQTINSNIYYEDELNNELTPLL